MCLASIASTPQSLGDLVKPPCIVMDITSCITMTCRVNNNTNKVPMRFSASECYLNFTADKGGPLELPCNVHVLSMYPKSDYILGCCW